MRNVRHIRTKTPYKRYAGAIIWIVFVIACVALVLTLGWFIGNRLAWDTNQVTMKGTYIETLPTTLKTFHERRFLGIMRMDNKIFFPARIIERKLLQHYPRLMSVRIDTKWNSIAYTFTEREPVLVVCTTLSPVFPDVESVFSDELIDRCWYVDQDGIVFDTAPRVSGGVYAILIIPSAPEHLPLQVLENASVVQSLRLFIQELKAFHIDTEVILYNDQDMRFIGTHLFSSTLAHPGSIVFDTHEVLDIPDHGKLLERLQIAMNRGPFFEHIQKQGAAGFKYLDMRFSDKFFYKFSPTSTVSE